MGLRPTSGGLTWTPRSGDESAQSNVHAVRFECDRLQAAKNPISELIRAVASALAVNS